MAKIILTVDADVKAAETKFAALEQSLLNTIKSVSALPVNNDLTKQLNAIAKSYSAISKAAKAADDAEQRRQKNLLAAQKVETQKNKTLIEQEKLQQQKIKTTQTAKRVEIENAESLQKTAKITNEFLKIEHQHEQAMGKLALEEEKLRVKQESRTATVQKQAKATRDSTAATEGNRQSLLTMIPQIIKWNIAMTAVMAPLRMLKEGLADLNETLIKVEDSVIAVKRVISEDIPTKEISDAIFDIAKRYGQTYDAVSEITINFARAGLSWAESLKAAESAVIALNVAELDAAGASEGLLAIMSQFKLSTSDLTLVVDMLNKTADNYNVTTEKLFKALQRTGSSAYNARLELKDTIGIITALSAATNRSGENLGTAVNALIQYTTKAKALDIFASLSDDMAKTVEAYKQGTGTVLDIWRGLSEVINNANEKQAAILSDLANQEEVSDLASELHDELGDIFEETQEIYGTANTFRKNYFISLLGNIDTVTEAIETAGNAAGYSLEENEKYLSTYTAKVNTLKSTWEQVANDEQGLLEIKKNLVDLGTVTLEFIKSTGGLKTTLTAAATAAMVFAGPQIVGAFTKLAASMKTASVNTLNLAGNVRAYNVAREAANKANEEAIIAQNELASAEAAGTATEQIRTAATKAQTAATEAQAAAQNALNLVLSGGLAIIGLVAVAYMSLAGKYKQLQEEAHQARLETIQNFNAQYEESVKLGELYGKYNDLLSITERTTEQNKELSSVEEELVKIFESKSGKLKSLKKDTDEYRQALKELAEEEIKNRARDSAEAALDAKIEYRAFETTELFSTTKESKIFDEILKARQAEGKNENIAKYSVDNIVGWALPKRYQYNVPEFENAIEQFEYLKEFNEWLYKNGYEETNIYANTRKALKESQTASQEYLKIITESQVLQRLINNNFNITGEELNDIVQSIVKANGITGDYLVDYVKDIAYSTGNINNNIGKAGEAAATAAEMAGKAIKDANKNLAQIKDSYNDIIKAVEAQYEAEKKNAEIREKQLKVAEKALAVKEAQAALDEVSSEEYKKQALEEKRLSIAEKELEVEKALKALNEAKNQRNVRVYNAETGRFEGWTASASDVAKAEDNLAKAEANLSKADEALIDAEQKIADEITKAAETLAKAKKGYDSEKNSLNSWLRDMAYEEVKALLAGGNVVSDAQFKEIVRKWQNEGAVGENLERWSKLYSAEGSTAQNTADILGLLQTYLKKEYGIDVTPHYNSGTSGNRPNFADNTVSVYDSGGILRGHGGIKATRENETVLGPEMTKKLLEPVSNENFEKFARSLGIMFGASDRYAAKSGAIINNSSRTVSDSHNITLNGVPIPQQAAERYTIAELCAAMVN